MISAEGLYGLYRALKDLLKNPTKSRVRDFTTHKFLYFTQHYFNKTEHFQDGAAQFVTLANALNSGHFSLDAICVIMIGYYVTQFKMVTIKTLNTIEKLKELNKFYSVFEIKNQIQELNNLMVNEVSDDPFADFTQTKTNVYKVSNDQKNLLYEYVKSGKVNILCFVISWHNNLFNIDETKITDKDYKHFIQYVKVIRHNMYNE